MNDSLFALPIVPGAAGILRVRLHLERKPVVPDECAVLDRATRDLTRRRDDHVCECRSFENLEGERLADSVVWHAGIFQRLDVQPAVLGFAQSARGERSDDQPTHCGCAGSVASSRARRIVTERLLDQLLVVLPDRIRDGRGGCQLRGNELRALCESAGGGETDCGASRQQTPESRGDLRNDARAQRRDERESNAPISPPSGQRLAKTRTVRHPAPLRFASLLADCILASTGSGPGPAVFEHAKSHWPDIPPVETALP